MAKFIEVTPIKYGEEQPRMLISTEKNRLCERG